MQKDFDFHGLSWQFHGLRGVCDLGYIGLAATIWVPMDPQLP